MPRLRPLAIGLLILGFTFGWAGHILTAAFTHPTPKQYICDVWRDDKRVSTIIANAKGVDLLTNIYTLECTKEDGTKGWLGVKK